MNYLGNNHGGILKIEDNYYIFIIDILMEYRIRDKAVLKNTNGFQWGIFTG